MKQISTLKTKMIEFNNGDPKRIQHFIKVHSFAKMIGELENIDPETQFILEVTSILHDIGIRPAEQKFGSCTGKLQEQEGVAPAKKMLEELNFPENVINRVCYLISHHHTYKNIDGIDYQILVEADFLVNLYEENSSEKSIKTAMDKIFKTQTGIYICKEMFLAK